MSETYKLDFGTNYKPDILSCLADLSNDEVFTPPEIANAMLDLLPKEIWSDPNIKILDPACKTGVFLREAAKRFIEGEKDIYPDLQERLDHIFHEQLYGLAITELTSLISRRSVYCSKYPNGPFSIVSFSSSEGNLRFKNVKHKWINGTCIYCGASENQFGDAKRNGREYHAYEFIHISNLEELFNMKFDVIISNPPYQLNDGGGSNGISAKPIYNKFIEQAIRLSPNYLCMIVPSRWFAGGKGLDDFRKDMLSDKRISTIVHYPKSRDCFSGVDIAGGVNYFLWNKNYAGDCSFTVKTANDSNTAIRSLGEYPILVSDNVGVNIVRKVKSKCSHFISEYVLSRNSFGFTTSSRGMEKPFKNAVKLFSSKGVYYVGRNEVTKNKDLVDKYKVSVGTLNPDRGGVNNASDGLSWVTTKVRILGPNEVVTETYVIVNTFDTEDEANYFANYLRTRFARYLIFLTLSSMHIVKDNFQFVPVVDFNKNWTDEELYEYFSLNDTEIQSIESQIRVMEG